MATRLPELFGSQEILLFISNVAPPETGQSTVYVYTSPSGRLFRQKEKNAKKFKLSFSLKSREKARQFHTAKHTVYNKYDV